jgi:outer membrane protein W
MGVSVPLSDFASTDINNEGAGYAQSSFFLSFDGAYLFSPYIGINGMFSFANNTLNTTKVKENLKIRIKEQYPDLIIPDELYISYNLGVWNHIGLQIGPQVTLPMERLNIDLRALGGLSFILPPSDELYFYNTETGQEFRTISDNKEAVSWGYTLGVGFRYYMSDKYILRFVCDYTYTEAVIEISNNFTEAGLLPDITHTNYTQAMGAIHVGLGIGYHF